MPQPMQQQPMTAYGPAPAGDIGQALGKRVIFLLVFVGAMLVVIGHLVSQLTTEIEYERAGIVIAKIGGLMAFGFAAAGALGSKRTTDWQSLGLLVVAAAFAFSQI
jgi:hypothetical protein